MTVHWILHEDLDGFFRIWTVRLWFWISLLLISMYDEREQASLPQYPHGNLDSMSFTRMCLPTCVLIFESFTFLLQQ